MNNKIKIVEWDIDKLIGSEYNPRILTEKQAADLEASIKRFGVVDPALVNVNKDRYGVIICGHMRSNIAKKMGFKTMPCIELDLTLEKEKELNIRLNKNTGGWNHDDLANYFDIEDLAGWGWSNEELKFAFGDVEIEEETDIKPKEVKLRSCPNCGHEF